MCSWQLVQKDCSIEPPYCTRLGTDVDDCGTPVAWLYVNPSRMTHIRLPWYRYFDFFFLLTRCVFLNLFTVRCLRDISQLMCGTACDIARDVHDSDDHDVPLLQVVVLEQLSIQHALAAIPIRHRRHFHLSLNRNHTPSRTHCNPCLSGARTFTCSKMCGRISIPRAKAYCRCLCWSTSFTSLRPRCEGGVAIILL